MNKEVPVEQIISIIQEAKSRGWRLAKFYFMTGLPFVDREKELDNIVNFLSQIRNATKINMNINIGTFIPKVHTPFQWVKQMSMEESGEHLRAIKKALMQAIPGIKVSYHEPSISFLEGIVSRGGYECADLIQKAYELGCRLDAWDEYIKWDLWMQAVTELNYDTTEKEWDLDEELPWDSVSMNVSKKYLKNEYLKARDRQLTSICHENCDHNCGVCGKNAANVVRAENEEFLQEMKEAKASEASSHGPYVQTIFTYKKEGRAIYNSHIAVMRQFEMAFQRAGLNILFTQGFNPKPKMEFLNPITMGVTGENELLLCELPIEEANMNTVERINNVIAEGFVITSVRALPLDPTGKKISLASKMLGSVYEISSILDPELNALLESRLTQTHPDYSISVCDGVYTVKISGDKNLFKLVFSPDINKFRIAGSCHITRKYIEMEGL